MEHDVTLYVNTDTIGVLSVDENCNFGQPKQVPNEDYTIEVNVGDVITWSCDTKGNAGDVSMPVAIWCELGEGGSNVLGAFRLSNNGTSISAQVLTKGFGEPSETYSIFFKVMNDGVLRGIYSIDPKIQVHSKIS
ncbi:MAG: hypothetical protein IPO92_16030 [Saprospiraceae bacterium]|nr:hypothetical protein [Saprospiraceae bacterium]